ncbi:amino acid ABC transporter substrate-binding protein [Sporosarcina sp. 179-K 3D1 HS]|uniref:amino acid ABC transporter substrate-binding protein n=1 Tax=Sporosarcina sp. 179-K 3D1 HS TaxID=3232169 RepID=UPI0039A0F39D
MRKHHRKVLLTLISIILLLAVAACGKKEGANASAESEKKVLKVGTTGLVYPFSFKENDKLQGFDVEVIEKVAENLGYEIQWQLADFSGLMGQLESGKIDTVANQVAVNAERQEKFNFTGPYAYDGTQILVREDNNEIQSVEDLKGKTVAAVLGSNHAKNLETADTSGEVKIKTYEAHDGTLHEVEFGRVDAYVSGRNILSAELGKIDLPLKMVGEPITFQEVAFPFVKEEENDALIEEFNKVIDKLREDGTLKEISDKYFKEDITVEANN